MVAIGEIGSLIVDLPTTRPHVLVIVRRGGVTMAAVARHVVGNRIAKCALERALGDRGGVREQAG